MKHRVRQQSSIPKRAAARKRSRFFDCERSTLWEERFQDFNTKYFKGRLPKYEVYLCGGCSGRLHLDAQCVSEEKRILMLDEGRSFRQLLATLLHEMIHIKVRWHRDRFVKEWNRIRRMGAPVGKWQYPSRNWEANWAPFGRLKLSRQNVRDLIWHHLWEPNPMETHLYRTQHANNLWVARMLEEEFRIPRERIEKTFNIPELLKETERELTEEAKARLARYRELELASFRRLRC
jgi:hypothetical protein